MKKKIVIALIAAGCLGQTVGVFAQDGPRLIETVVKKGNEIVIPYQKYVLPNGLTVILTEDHSDPIAHVDVTYHVGSAREQVGKSGFAHFFEHMMFQGSDHVANGDHFKIITEAGGTLNGSTNRDRTNYFETVPSNQLEKMLWLESDRMGFLLDAVTQRKFEVQRATVKNERGQNYDNKPYGLAFEVVGKNLYPYGHPYSWLTIGYIEDLNRVGVSDLKDFFLRWYGPNNATLTVGGDINVEQTLAWINKYFGSIPRGPEVENLKLPSPVLSGNRYVSYTDNYAKLPLLFVSYPGVKMYHEDMAALDALSMIIGQGKNSVFYKNFIKSRKAAQAGMYSSNSELAGEIMFQIVPFAGQSLAEMDKILQESLTEFEKRGVTDGDLQRFKAQLEAKVVNSLASISGKVSMLAASQTFRGTPNSLASEIAAIRKVSKEDVMRVYRQYVKDKGAVVLSVLPKEADVQPVAADNYVAVEDKGYQAPDYGYGKTSYRKAKDSFDRNVQPPAGPNPFVKVPLYWTAKTANGIPVIGSFSNEIPSVYLAVSVKGGSLHAVRNPEKAGLASVVAAMLNEGTQNYTSEKISSELEKTGSQIGVSAAPEEIVFSLSALSQHLDQTLPLLDERLFRPKFTQEGLDRVKKQMMQGFEIARTQAATIASDVFSKVLYGKDNIRTYGLKGNEKTITGITLRDVQDFYDQYISSNLASVVIVGDITQEASLQKLGFLTDWKNTKAAVPDFSAESRPVEKKTLYLVNMPKAAQSEIRIGYLTGVNFDATGTYYRLGLVNYSLGDAFNSRINLSLREEKGWTYGAYSGFSSGKFGGSFTASAGVIASVTDSAVTEFINQIDLYRTKGMSEKELTFTRKSVSQAEARRYETNKQKAEFLARMYRYNLDASFVKEQAHILDTIGIETLNKLSDQYLDTEKMAIVVVGDKEHILPDLQKLGYEIVELDADGNII